MIINVSAVYSRYSISLQKQRRRRRRMCDIKSNDKLHNVKWLRKPNALNVLERGFSNKTSFTFLRSLNISCAAKRIIILSGG